MIGSKKLRLRSLIGAGLLAIPAYAIGQGQAHNDPVQTVLAGSYLGGLNELERARAGATGDALQILNIQLDMARSFIFGASAGYVSPSDDFRCQPHELDERSRGAEAVDPIGEIVRRARHTRIVILNEDHLDPRHRAFALRVARSLRPLGYRYLAVEALTNIADTDLSSQMMSDLVRRGYIVHSTGIYTNEPMFADFIRQALAMGYRPHGYDGLGSPGAADPIDGREEAQARTIEQRILGRDPQAKVLIYVGFAHVAEAAFQEGRNRGRLMMGARLKAITGIDPLTIDQTLQVGPDCMPASTMRRFLHANRYGDVLLRRRGANLVSGRYRGAVDLQVLHLPTDPIRGRPAWMTQIGRRAHNIPRALRDNRTTRLVQAFRQGSSADAVPVDQLLIVPGQAQIPPLMVPYRDVLIRTQDLDR